MSSRDSSTHISLEAVDRDGAIGEAAEAVAGDSRLGFLRKAGVAGAGAVGGGAILGALASTASAKPSAASDVKILNYALTLEYLEAAFYAEAVAGNALSGRTADFAKLVAADEATHVSTLKKALGSKAVAEPKFNFQGIPNDQGKFQQTAFTLENTGVHAYLGQAAKLTPGVLKVAASIVTVEARHAALIADIIGGDISNATPNGAFDKPTSMATILATVKKTGFIAG
jgi:rubrerythrin